MSSSTVKGIYELSEAWENNFYLRIAVSPLAHDEVLILKRHPYIRAFLLSKASVKLYEVLRLRKPYYLPVPKDRTLTYPFPLKCEGKHYDFGALISDTQLPEAWIELPHHRFVISISTFGGRQPPFDNIAIGFGDEGEQFIARFRKTEKGFRPWDASLAWPVPHYYGTASYPVIIETLGKDAYQYIDGLSPEKIREARDDLWETLKRRFGESPKVEEGLMDFAEVVLGY